MSEESRDNYTRLHDANTVGCRFELDQFWLEVVDYLGSHVVLHVTEAKAVAACFWKDIVLDLELEMFSQHLHDKGFIFGKEGDMVLSVIFAVGGTLHILIGAESKIEISVVE